MYLLDTDVLSARRILLSSIPFTNHLTDDFSVVRLGTPT